MFRRTSLYNSYQGTLRVYRFASKLTVGLQDLKLFVHR